MNQVLDAKSWQLLNGRVALKKQMLLIALIGLLTGGIGAQISQVIFPPQSVSQGTLVPTKEIIVPQKGGLQFRTEDGTPLARIIKNEYGTSVQVLSKENKPVVAMSELQGKGLVSVGTKDGTNIHISALETGGTIVMIGQYGKDVVEISSATDDGSGKILLNEGTKGWPRVEISGEKGKEHRGKIHIYDEDGIIWHSP